MSWSSTMANARLPHDLEAAREAASLRPNNAPLALAYGEALLYAGRLPDAIAELQRALRIDYTFADARFALGCAWLQAGEPDKALESFSHLEEDDEVTAKISQAEAIRAQPRSDAGYVRHLFDQFSADYDARMIGQLGYRAPQILRELFDLLVPGRERLAILDLGCGTGLASAAFKDVAARLDGVDLSPAMIEKARARKLYDALVVGDIETMFNQAGQYDLILAADTLVYLGDLEPIFAGASQRLKPGGFFLFTVESKDGGGFELGPKRRWRHSEPYLRAQAAKAGLDVAGFMSAVPRREANHSVEGFAVALSLGS
jgi:predicted TPR repeat methyltransferase